MKVVFFILFFFSFSLLAETPKDVFLKLQDELGSPLCKERLKQLSEYRLLFVLSQYQKVLETTKTSKEFRDVLGTWSADLLLKIALQLEGEFSSICAGNPKMDLTLRELKRAYLGKLGLGEKDFSEKELDTFFRTCIAVREDQATLIKRVAELKKANVKGLKLLQSIYGSAFMEKGIAIVAEKGFKTGKVTALLEEFCPGFPCLFWSPTALSKLVVTQERGVAAFLPEVSTLVVSSEILNEPNMLMKIIFLHELAHVAEKNAWNTQSRDWKAEFAFFSGWKKNPNGTWSTKADKLPLSRQDLLTELSKGSLYSILPDDVYVGVGEKKKSLDGFVFAKSYTESLKRENPSEDLADAIAVFFYMPTRFCLEGKPFAPEKYRWISLNVFPGSTPMSCQKGGSK